MNIEMKIENTFLKLETLRDFFEINLENNCFNLMCGISPRELHEPSKRNGKKTLSILLKSSCQSRKRHSFPF